jgi:flagellar biosynthesis protein FlhG
MNKNRLKDIDITDAKYENYPLVVALMSGKGGVGKSVIAYNLGIISASEDYKTLLVDADRNFGNLHILGNTCADLSLSDVLENRQPVSEAIVPINDYCDLMTLSTPGNFEEGRSDSKVNRFLGKIKYQFDTYDIIIIDTASSDLKTIETLAHITDVNLIVINPELTSISDGYGLFKYLTKIEKNIQAHLFVNRAECEADYEFIYQKFTVLAQKFLNRVPLNAGFLANDRYLVDTVAHQKPLLELKGDSESVKRLTRLFKLLTKCRQVNDYQFSSRLTGTINSKKEFADIKG